MGNSGTCFMFSAVYYKADSHYLGQALWTAMLNPSEWKANSKFFFIILECIIVASLFYKTFSYSGNKLSDTDCKDYPFYTAEVHFSLLTFVGKNIYQRSKCMNLALALFSPHGTQICNRACDKWHQGNERFPSRVLIKVTFHPGEKGHICIYHLQLIVQKNAVTN